MNRNSQLLLGSIWNDKNEPKCCPIDVDATAIGGIPIPTTGPINNQILIYNSIAVQFLLVTM